MNYAVHVSFHTDLGRESRLIAYRITQANGARGVQLMGLADAQALAATLTAPKVTVEVLALEADREITAA